MIDVAFRMPYVLCCSYVATMVAAMEQADADFVKLSAWFLHDLQTARYPAMAYRPFCVAQLYLVSRHERSH